MDRGLLGKIPRRADQPGMAFVALPMARQRIARMQVKRHAEPLDLGPERPILRQVVINRGVGGADLGKTVDQRALEFEIAHAALEFGGCGLRILHRQRRERGKAVGPLGDGGRQRIVGFTRQFHRLGGLGNFLNAVGVEREHRATDAGRIHFRKAPVEQIDELAFDARPIRMLRKAHRF